MIEIKGPTQPLRGRVKIRGAKNSSLPLLIASVMAKEECILDNVPEIKDVDTICTLMRALNISVDHEGHRCRIHAKELGGNRIILDQSMCEAVRVSYYFMGALIHAYDEVWIGKPGGDNIGKRPIDQHIKGFEALGIRVSMEDGFYVLQKEELHGGTIYFDMITCGATINTMMAAVMAKGRTILHNAAVDPEVVDVAVFLNKMGAKIRGAGTKKVTIEGVEKLHGANHYVVPDRLVAGTLLIAAGLTKGEIVVEDVIPFHLAGVINKLHELGMNFTLYEGSIKGCYKEPIRGGKIICGMYPTFPTDLQQPLTALLLTAKGESQVTDSVFPSRFGYCEELKKMGANLETTVGSAKIKGGYPLYGAEVFAGDIRGGMALLLASLVAEGTTFLHNEHHIYRGYAHVIDVFTSLGCDIQVK